MNKFKILPLVGNLFSLTRNRLRARGERGGCGRLHRQGDYTLHHQALQSFPPVLGLRIDEPSLGLPKAPAAAPHGVPAGHRLEVGTQGPCRRGTRAHGQASVVSSAGSAGKQGHPAPRGSAATSACGKPTPSKAARGHCSRGPEAPCQQEEPLNTAYFPAHLPGTRGHVNRHPPVT